MDYLKMLNIKVLMGFGLVAVTLLLVWFTYNQGVEVGVNKAIASYSDANDKAVAQYQSRVADLSRTHNAAVKAIRRRYNDEASQQQAEALKLSQRLRMASEQSVEIIERIRYVESDCINIGVDAFSLYERTRGIVSDPRNPNTS